MIQYLENLTDDQMANQFEVLFIDAIPGGGDNNLLKLRMDQQFDMPEDLVATYEVEYSGIKTPKTSSKEDTDKRFTLNFRVDINLIVYRSLENWHDKVLNKKDGSAGTEAETRITMIFNAFGPGRRITYSKKYEGVKIFGLKPTTWDHTSPDPTRVEAQFIYSSAERLV